MQVSSMVHWTNRKGWFAAPAVVVAVVALALWPGSPRHVAAASAPASGPDTVAVSGVGTVQGVPDTLTAALNVHVTRGSVQGALDAESSAVHRVLAALKHHGVSGRDVQTASLGLSQHYDNHGRVTGYDAFETVTGKITPLTGAGATISAAASASGNDVAVDGLSFDIADDKSLLTDARAKAYADAKGRAQQYADLTSRQLGTVVKVSEVVQSEQLYPQRYAGDALSLPMAAAGKAVPIQAGEQPVTVTVSVVWRLG